jgi:hypothetical protein
MHSRHSGEEELYFYPYPTLMLEGDKRSALRPGRFTSLEETLYPLYRRLCGPHAHQGLNPDHAAPNESLYRLRFDLRHLFVNCLTKLLVAQAKVP